MTGRWQIHSRSAGSSPGTGAVMSGGRQGDRSCSRGNTSQDCRGQQSMDSDSDRHQRCEANDSVPTYGWTVSRCSCIRSPVSGRSSVVESLLPKQVVVGSNPIARSKLLSRFMRFESTTRGFRKG